MIYAHIQDSTIVKTGPRPKWLIDGDTPEESRPLTDEEFAEHGWFPVQDADPVPEGKIVTGRNVEIIDGLPKWVNTLEDAPPPSARDVDAERDRRIAGGFEFAGKRYQSRFDDRENIAGASTAALAAMVNGAQKGDYRWHGGDSDFVWIAEDNSLNPMDAQTVFAFGRAAMAHKQAHIFAARALKDADPIPGGYQDDSYWP